MLRISKLADYAVIITGYMAQKPGKAVSATEVGMRAQLSTPTVRKVMKQLLNKGILISSRGATGGYQLASSANQVNLATIVEAIDGPISLVECANPERSCFRQEHCCVQENWQVINQVIKRGLQAVTLDTLS